MKLDALRSIYDTASPFVTVYLEGRSPGEDAEQQVRLRWDELRGRLDAAGVQPSVLETLDDAVIVEEITEVQTNGRVLVANATGVLLDAEWDAALGAGDGAHVSENPELGAYIRERARSVRILVAIADQHGAIVRRVVATGSHNLDEKAEEAAASSSEESVHQPRGGGMAHNQIRRRAEETVKQNVREVAARLDQIAKNWKPDVLVVAGEVQGRGALRDELPPSLQEIYREVDEGGLDDERTEDILTDGLRAVARKVGADRAQEHTERFEHAKALGRSAQGAQALTRAMEMGAVETLLLEYDRPATNEASLLAAGVSTGADVGLVDQRLTDAVGAVLRFEAPDEITEA